MKTVLEDRRSRLARASLTGAVAIAVVIASAAPAWAGLNDDRFDGSIFPLYAGNGSLVPPRVTLAESIRSDRPTLLVLYIDDSSDCKRYSSVVSQVDAFYGRAANIIPIDVDSISVKDEYDPMEPGYYYQGLVPQTVIFDQTGNVALNETGQVDFNKIDDRFREIFDLLPRSESQELKRRTVNEVNSELVQEDE
jgi:hypothetical protein